MVDFWPTFDMARSSPYIFAVFSREIVPMAIVSFERRFLFVHIPKCGGTSIEDEWRRHLMTPTDLLVTSALGANQNDRHRIGHHSTYSVMLERLGASYVGGFVTCALVREPLKVVGSYYTYGRGLFRDRVRRLVNRLGFPEARAQAQALGEVADGNTEAFPDFVYVSNRGTARDAITSSSFDEYLERVGDDRWSNYLRSYVCADGDDIAVKHVLKLEDPIGIRRFFKTRVSKGFELLHANRSASQPLEWSDATRRRYLDLTADEYELFGYRA